MKRSFHILGITAATALLVSCVSVKKMSLYEGVAPAQELAAPEWIGQVVEPQIYHDSPEDMWGLETTVCKQAQLVAQPTYLGSHAIALTWDRNTPGCVFAGIGIGWDHYAGKDLSAVMSNAAIQFYVRSQKDKMFSLPIVLTLEDYSGGMGFAYTANKYFERVTLDTTWQQVRVPLSAFDLETENLDVSNIKQLQLELQQSGAVYLDEIQLVPYTPVKQEPWLEAEKLPDPLRTPLLIFGDSFIDANGWGILSNACQHTELTSATAVEGDTSLHARWQNTDECYVAGFGASWYRWHPVDASTRINDLNISFSIKYVGAPTTTPGIAVGLEDYDRRTSVVALSAANVEGNVYDHNWRLVTIPFSDLKGDFDFTAIKQLIVKFEGSGEAYIDAIRLTQNPNQ